METIATGRIGESPGVFPASCTLERRARCGFGERIVLMRLHIRTTSVLSRSRCSGAAVGRLLSLVLLAASAQTWRNGARQADVDHGAAQWLTSVAREEWRRVRRELRVITKEREFPKGTGLLL
jgi:hypothetical protein